MSDDADHAEEQEMEAEALTAIFDTHFHRDGNIWTLELYPHIADEEINHVGCKLIATIPCDYPSVSLPQLQIEVLQGLAHDEHVQLLQELADEEALANEGEPSIFAICERLREWLMENNVKGLDDQSMHAQMIRKQQLQTKQQTEKLRLFEAQQVQEVFSQGELEEMQVRKRREEGTPCNKENFEAWKVQFEKEMAEAKAAQGDSEDGGGGSSSNKKTAAKSLASTTTSSSGNSKSTRLTGYQLFAANMNLEALEAAAEQAQADEDEEENLEEVDEELFQDDVDLDDLEFDDSEEEEDDDVDI